MSIDAEISRINEGIASVHLALYKFNNQLDGFVKRLNGMLNNFDRKVENVVGEVNGVGEEVLSIFQHFPNNIVYYTLIVMLIIILHILCIYLVYYIYKWITERRVRVDKEMRYYNKKVYSVVGQKRTKADSMNLPVNCIDGEDVGAE